MNHFLFAFVRTGFFALLFLTGCIQADARTIHSRSVLGDASIGDLVWLDRNANGIQDAGEPGFSGVEVLLLDDGGRQLASTFTDINGKYSFAGLETGTSGKGYELWFRLPDNFQFCRKNGTISDTQNSDASELNGRTGIILLMPGEINTAVDAGIISAALGTLPLHTLDLTADLKGGNVILKWLAENEMNTERFVVQQSTDGIHFTTINIRDVNGAINIPTYYYHTTDVSRAGANILYFRIRAEDASNRAAYSNVALIRLDKPVEARVWPNPFANELHISYFSTAPTSLAVMISDAAGKEKLNGVFEISRGMNQLTLGQLGSLSSGIYYLQLTDKMSGITFTRKIIR